jgi:hypothetical protein
MGETKQGPSGPADPVQLPFYATGILGNGESGTAIYVDIGSAGFQASELPPAQYCAPQRGLFHSLRVCPIQSDADVTGNFVFTARINGADSNLVATIAGDSDDAVIAFPTEDELIPLDAEISLKIDTPTIGGGDELAYAVGLFWLLRS